MKLSMRTIALAAIVSALAACAHVTPHYGMSSANIEAIRQVAGPAPQKVSVGTFTAWKPNVVSYMCRGAGSVGTPDHEPFSLYIQNALTDELKAGGVYAADSPVRIDGNLDYIVFDSNVLHGKWTIDLTVSGAASGPVKLHENYEFSTNWVADRACAQVAEALQPSVQDLLAKLYASPAFKAMVTGAK